MSHCMYCFSGAFITQKNRVIKNRSSQHHEELLDTVQSDLVSCDSCKFQLLLLSMDRCSEHWRSPSTRKTHCLMTKLLESANLHHIID